MTLSRDVRFERCSMHRVAVAIVVLCCVLFGESSSAEMWLGFRGTAGDAVSTERNLPNTWSENQGILWSTPLPGASNSSPAVTSDRVYITSFDSKDASLIVVSVDRADGRILWKKVVGYGQFIAYGPPELYRHRHNPATPSPCADEDDNVYAFFGTGDLVSLDRNGQIRWQRNLADDYGPYDLKFGMGASPRYWKKRLFIGCIHKGPSYVLALETATGKEVWLADRNYQCLGDATDAYTSPVVLDIPRKRPQLIMNGADHVDAYDLETGERIWENGGLVLENEEYARTIASAAVGEEIVVAPSAKAKLAVAVKADGKGDVTKNADSRVLPIMVDCPTPTIYQGRIYVVKDDGVGSCLDLKTGKELWKSRMGGERYQASPVAGDGKVYFLSLEGKCTVIEAGPKLSDKRIENVLPGEFYATPAVSNGVIFLRDRSRLIAIGIDDKSASKVSSSSAFDFDYQVDASFPQWPEKIKKGPISSVAADSKGRVIAFHRESPPIVVFDASGKYVTSFGEGIIGNGGTGAHGVSVDKQDNIWVTDIVHHVVFRFSPQGKLEGMLGGMDQPSEDLDKFNKPTFIVFGPQNNWYVIDGYGNSRIVHYRDGGQHPEAWGKAGTGPLEFNQPHSGIIDKQGRLVVCDRENLRIQVLNAQTGVHIETWTGYRPSGITMDQCGNIFISDGATARILQLDSHGGVVRGWGKSGTAAGEFNGSAHLICADLQGNLFTAETGGRRLQKFRRISSNR
jgi:outer membrane protein assembly factor BamB